MARGADRINVAAKGWMNQTFASRWPAPECRVKGTFQRAWGLLGLQRASREFRPSWLAARGEAQMSHKISQNSCSIVMVGLHQTAEPVAAKGMRNVVILDGVTTCALRLAPKDEPVCTPMLMRPSP
jgi:hypothetical protein